MLLLYFGGKQLLAALQKALSFAAGPPQHLADNIEVPGTGQTAGALRATGWTDDQINAIWGEAMANPSEYGQTGSGTIDTNPADYFPVTP